MKQEEQAVTQRKKTRVYSAKEKAEAVLALWSGRRNVSGLMTELKVPWGLVSSWEKRALVGMLNALDPKRQLVASGSVELPGRLEKLINHVMNPEPALPAEPTK